MNLNNWLTENGLDKYAPLFEANDIDDLNVVVSLSEADLESMGIPLGGRRKILGAIAALTPQGHEEPPAPTSTEQHVEEAPALNVPQLLPTGQPESEVPAPSSAAPAPDQAYSSPSSPDVAVHAPQATYQHAIPSAPTKVKPKGSPGSKATAIIIAVIAHVVIALVATLFVILPPLKENPEIVAYAVTQNEKKQEMKKKTVQKQVKRSPSSASAAAAPMALMMKANAKAEFAVPDVKVTSTGPLGVGDGELGNGGFGAGTGLGSGDGQGGAMFFGTTTKGQLAVIFDISASMYGAVPEVVKEINRSFKDSQVLAMFSGGFNNKDRTKMIPYKSNSDLQKYVEINASLGKGDTIRNSEKMNRALFRLERCDSLVPANKNVTKQNIYNNFQSLGVGIETLVKQDKPPGTIFVFSDFRDPHSPAFMNQVAKLCVEKKVKVIFWNPLPDTPPIPAPYRSFAKTVGGEVKVEEL